MNYRVLIVEDDINYRYAIKETVKWKENGFEIAGEAIHGKQAMEFLDKNKVDIVLTDMSMPLMNGVELTKEIREKYPHIIVIALSAFDDFQFVKESLKYGAKDYILKQEMNPEDMIKILRKAYEEKNVEKDFVLEEEKRRHEIQFLLRGEKNISENTRKHLDFLLKGKMFFLALVVLKNSSISIFDLETLQDKKILYKTTLNNGNIILLCEAAEEKSEINGISQMRALAENIKKNAEEVYVCISDRTFKTEDLSILYKQVLTLMDIQPYFEKIKILLYYEYEAKLKNRDKTYRYKEFEHKELASLDQIKEEMDCMTKILCRKLPDEENLNKNFLDFCKNCIYKKLRKLEEWNPIYFYEKLLKLKKLSEKIDFTMDTILNERDKMNMDYNGKSPEIIKALKYIYLHYPEEISLFHISSHVGLSENYFSNLFKAEMGENLTRYINKVRIDKAKQLMDTTNMKVYEIAESVGYHNATYFCTIFKKITNMAVSEYRKNDTV